MRSICFVAVNIAVGAIALGLSMGGALAQAEPKFGTRSPRVCDSVTSKPTPEQAAALFQCGREYKYEREISLMEDVKVQMGGSQPYNFDTHSRLTSVDTTSKIYPIRGRFTYWHCDVISVIPAINSDNRGKNCFYSVSDAGEGYCWATTFGDWKCSMNDTRQHDLVRNQPPPAS